LRATAEPPPTIRVEIQQLRGLALMTKQLSLAMILSICVGSGMAWSNLQTVPSVAGVNTKTDFDQIFADATGQGELNTVNRARKGDRLPSLKPVLLELLLLPHCEPLASRFADPILGHIVGRCAACTSPIFPYETERSRCQPALPGSDFARRSAIASPSRNDLRVRLKT
jgi:hypothetical protein